MKFEDALKRGEGFTLLQVSVSAGAREFGFSGYNEWRRTIELRVKNQAREGRANREIVKELERLFGARVEIVKGGKSSSKTLKIHTDYVKIVEILRKIFDNLDRR